MSPLKRLASISAERAQAILAAFQGSDYDVAQIATAGSCDDAGSCAKFCCAADWSISSSGLGTCPAEHFKGLDPHWHPDWNDL